jgi:hypothetical protein
MTGGARLQTPVALAEQATRNFMTVQHRYVGAVQEVVGQAPRVNVKDIDSYESVSYRLERIGLHTGNTADPLLFRTPCLAGAPRPLPEGRIPSC